MNREPVDKITSDQHSLITSAQFVAATNSRSALRWAVDDGWLERYERWRAMFIVAGAQRTPYQPHMAATLLGGELAAASGFAGAWLWDTPDVAADCLPEITILGGPSRRVRGAVVRRSDLCGPGDIAFRHGIPTASAPLVVVQLAQLGAGFLAERVANNLIGRTLTSPRGILETLERVGDRRRGTAALRTFCLKALEVRGHDDSPAARDLGAAMIAAGVPPFVTQHHVEVEGHDYFLDFAWPPEMVALEYMGWNDHGAVRSSFDNDAIRRSRLGAAGWRVLDATSGATHPQIIRWVLAALGQSSR